MNLLAELGKIAGVAGLTIGLIALLGRPFFKTMNVGDLTPAQRYKLLSQFAYLMFGLAALGIFAYTVSSKQVVVPPNPPIETKFAHSLKSAGITFVTGDKPKRGATQVNVELKRQSTSFAEKKGIVGRFDKGQSATFPLDTLSPFGSNDVASSTLQISIAPRRNEAWTFDVTLTLTFSEGPETFTWSDRKLSSSQKTVSLALKDAR